MKFEIKKASRSKAKLRIGLSGTAGSGKTWSALLIAFGLTKNGKIGLIDTENGSGDLYSHLGDYDIIHLSAPYLISDYLGALDAFINEGYDVVIVDSLSPAWAGVGGLLDKHSAVTLASKDKNSYNAWRLITPEHNSLVEKMLSAPCHIIATMRSKTEYVIEKDDKGRSVPRKVGLSPIQREGMDYEFTLMFDIEQDSHIAHASKDRTSLFDGLYFTPDKSTGEKLKQWGDLGLNAIETNIVLQSNLLGVDVEFAKNELLNKWIKPAYLNSKEPITIKAFGDIPEKHVSALLQKLPEKLKALVEQPTQNEVALSVEQLNQLENMLTDFSAATNSPLSDSGMKLMVLEKLNLKSFSDIKSNDFEEVKDLIGSLFEEK